MENKLNMMMVGPRCRAAIARSDHPVYSAVFLAFADEQQLIPTHS